MTIYYFVEFAGSIANIGLLILFVERLFPMSLSILIGNTFDNAIEACCSLPVEQRSIHLQLRKHYRNLFYRLDNPYCDTSCSLRVGNHHGYGLKNVKRIVQECDGDFHVEKKDGVFTIKVRLNCES